MERMNFQSDIAAVCGNTIFTEDKREQKWYEFSGFHTSFDSENQLALHFQDLRRLFKEINREIHCLIVPVRQSLDDVRDQYLEAVRGNLRVVAKEHVDAIFDYLKTSSELGAEENKSKFYIGIELTKGTVTDDDDEMSFGEIFEYISDWFKEKFHKVRGKSTYLTVERLQRALRAGREVDNVLKAFPFHFKKLSCEEMGKLIPWMFNLGVRYPQGWKGWEERFTPITNKKGEIIARVQTKEEVLNLQMTGIENPKGRRHLTLHQTDAKGGNHQTHVSYLHLVKMPDTIYFPDIRWLENLRNLPFGVGVSLKMTYQSPDKRIAKLRRQKDNLKDQVEHLRQFNDEASSNVYEGLALAEEVIGNVEKERDGSYLMSAIFAVSAPNLDLLSVRVKDLIEEYASIGFRLQNTYGLQLRSLMECLPGSKRYVTEFIQDVDVNAVTASFFGNRQELGDDYGAYLARTLEGKPVYYMPGLAASGTVATQSLVMVATGKTGGGKSVGGNHITYESALAGAKVMLLDPKAERKNLCHWDEKLTELGTELNFISFTNKDEDAGKLDPFLLFENRQDAADIAREIINYLLNINIRNNSMQSSVVARAVRQVSQRKNPSIRFVKEELRMIATDAEMTEEKRNIALNLASTLEELESISLARLIFAEPTNTDNVLNYANQLNVLQVDNLHLPNKDTPPEEYSEDNIISVAILFSLTAYMIRFMKMFPNDLTMIAIDEAWNFFQNPAGERLIDKLFREGRSLLSPILLMTQNLTDIPESMRGQIGMSFHFRTDESRDIEAINQFLRLDDSSGLEGVLPKLASGYCVFRDLQKRTGIMQMRVLQDHLFDAFDTSKDIREIAKRENEELENREEVMQ